MNRETYDDYIRRFNEQDMKAFETYIAPNCKITNETLEIHGIRGMKDHYARIWQTFTEELHIERFVSDGETLAVQMWTHFTALRDDRESPFGPVRAGETFDYRGVIIYQIEHGKFTDIRVAYNSFTYTNLEGEVVDRGIPH